MDGSCKKFAMEGLMNLKCWICGAFLVQKPGYVAMEVIHEGSRVDKAFLCCGCADVVDNGGCCSGCKSTLTLLGSKKEKVYGVDVEVKVVKDVKISWE